MKMARENSTLQNGEKTGLHYRLQYGHRQSNYSVVPNKKVA